MATSVVNLTGADFPFTIEAKFTVVQMGKNSATLVDQDGVAHVVMVDDTLSLKVRVHTKGV